MAYTPRAAASAATAAISLASATLLASGFSHSTCFPAFNAAMAISACVSPGVQMSTRSTSSRSTSARQSVSVLAQPKRRAASVTRPRSLPASAVSSGTRGRSKKRGAVRQACEWAAPIKAWPTIPTRSGEAVSGVVIAVGFSIASGFEIFRK